MIFDILLLLRWGKPPADLVKAAMASYAGKIPECGVKKPNKPKQTKQMLY